MIKIVRIIFYVFLCAWILAIMILADWIVSKPDRPPKAVGFDGSDILYEDAAGNLFKRGPHNRCIAVGKR